MRNPRRNRQRRQERQPRHENHDNRRGNNNCRNHQNREYLGQREEMENQMRSKEQNKLDEQKKEKTSKQKEEIPSFLLCPISQVLMVKPVLVTVCGHTFESAVIRQWVKKKPSCPLCNKSIEDPQKTLMRNFALLDVISHFKK